MSDRRVTQTQLYEHPECEHKWRAYEGIGVVCRDCGTAAPKEVAQSIACHNEDAERLS